MFARENGMSIKVESDKSVSLTIVGLECVGMASKMSSGLQCHERMQGFLATDTVFNIILFGDVLSFINRADCHHVKS